MLVVTTDTAVVVRNSTCFVVLASERYVVQAVLPRPRIGIPLSGSATHLPRVSAMPLCVNERRPDPLELHLDFVAADQVAEQIVLKGGAIGGGDTVLRVKVLRQELWIQPAWVSRWVVVEGGTVPKDGHGIQYHPSISLRHAAGG